MKRFREMIAEAMLLKGLKVETLARRIGTHKGYISGMRKGTVSPPSAKYVKRLARVLGLDYTGLLVAAEVDKIHPDVQDLVRQMVTFGMERVTLPVKGVPSPKEPAAAVAAG